MDATLTWGNQCHDLVAGGAGRALSTTTRHWGFVFRALTTWRLDPPATRSSTTIP